MVYKVDGDIEIHCYNIKLQEPVDDCSWCGGNNCKGKKDIEQPMSDVQPFQEMALVAGEIVGQFYFVLKIGSMEIEHMLEA